MKELSPRIVVNSDIQFGKPIIAGTRVPVDVIIGHLAGGDTMDEVAKEYGITQEDIQAALKYASKVIGEETLIYRGALSH